jgi:hypothetical protein
MTKAFPLKLSPTRSIGASRMVTLAYLSLLGSVAILGACQPKPVAQTPAAQAVPADTNAGQGEISAPLESVPSQAPVTPSTKTAPPKASAKVQARKSEESAAAGRASSITGGWVNAGGACDSGASVQFNPDGTYMSEGENGTWALEGKTLTVTTALTPDAERVAPVGPEQSTGDSGEKAVLTILSVTDSAANVILSNGTNANWTRCSG